MAHYAHYVKTGVVLYHKIAHKELAGTRELGVWLRGELQRTPLTAKIGQWASNRPDVFGDDLCSELRGLCRDVPCMPVDELEKVLRAPELAGLVVDADPIAAASMGQVHTATIRATGARVAVKVRRRAAVRALHNDAMLLEVLLKVAKVAKTKNVDYVEALARDMMDAFRAEGDFRQEVKNMQAFQSVDSVVVPRVYTDLCTVDAIVMDYVPSAPVTEAAGKKALAKKLMEVFLSQLLEGSVVHADLHPGNYGVSTEGDLVLYDFGNVVHVTPELQRNLKNFMLAMVVRDAAEAARILEHDMNLLVHDRDLLHQWILAYCTYIKTPGLDATAVFAQIDNPQAQPVVFTPELMRLVRAFSALEGVCATLDPGFHYLQLVDTFMDSVLANQTYMEYRAARDARRLFQTFFSTQDV